MTNHDVQFTQFEISQNNREIIVTINVEKIDLFNSLRNFEIMTSAQRKTEINDYLQRKTFWKINKTPFSVCDYSFIQKKNHFIIKGYIENIPEEIKHIYFMNAFLNEEIFGQLNIIHFNLNHQLRSFKMNANRQEITLEYN
jgi:hypothetical protein